MIRIAKQHKDEPGPLKFAHFFENAITVDEVFKFLQKTEIVTRNWLQNQGRIEEEKADEGVEKGEEQGYKGVTRYWNCYGTNSNITDRRHTKYAKHSFAEPEAGSKSRRGKIAIFN